jgi:hypothetical protein
MPRRSVKSPAAPRRRPPRSTLALPARSRDHLEARGARSDKSHGPFNYSRQLARTLELYDSVLVKSDPRKTCNLSQDHYELIVAALTDPLALESFHIARLGDYLLELPAFRARARERQLDPEKLRDTLNALPYAEKLHLVDAAQIRVAPPPAR